MLVAKNITKKFPGVIALNHVNMEFHRGKVNAVIGENGAGKSTLMKIFSGIYQDYDGEIQVDGQTVRFANPAEAQHKGISIIHQELSLIPWLSISENIFLGRELVNRWGVLDKKAMRNKASSLLEKLKLPVSPDALVATLKVGQQQVVEIAKALLYDSDYIMMDEPTSAISDAEVALLFDIINDLKKENKAIVYISHKLNELFAIADRFIILRDGHSIESGDMKGMTQDHIIQKMVGRELLIEKQQTRVANKELLLSVKGLNLKHPVIKKQNLLQDISFSLSKGEVLGIFGLMGAGRTELLETIYGVHPGRMSGSIKIAGKDLNGHSTWDAVRAGLALVPEDRKRDGLVLGLDIKTNMTLPVLNGMSSYGLLQMQKEKKIVAKYIDELRIKATGAKQLAGKLSGGNQQKIVLAKCLAMQPKIIMLDEPTRGIDIGAKSEIYKLIAAFAAEGYGIIVVSSELPEILALSHRVLVMCEGRITAELQPDEATEDRIMKHAIPSN
jgi:ribose transport system ATP-binding protein